MKKLLIAAGVIGLMSTTQVFAQDTVPTADQPQQPSITKCDKANFDGEFHKMKKHPDFKKFEKELKLTDEQKAKAQEIRDNEREQIKPILDKIGEKYKEQKEIMDKRLTAEERQQELAPIREDIRALRGEIHKIKKQSKEAFESILTSKQLKQLDKMKDKAKKEFKQAKKEGRHMDWDRRRHMRHGCCPCPRHPMGPGVGEPPAEPQVVPPVDQPAPPAPIAE